MLQARSRGRIRKNGKISGFGARAEADGLDRRARRNWLDSQGDGGLSNFAPQLLAQNNHLGGIHPMQLKKCFDVSIPMRLICPTDGLL
jgi:hypothetical protein